MDYVVCISDDTTGLIGMIYLSLKSEVQVYGIRTTIFGLYNNEKKVSIDLLNGIFEYACKLEIDTIHVIRFPMGPMRKILKEMGFDTYQWTKSINEKL